MEALEHTHPDLNFDWASLVRDPALRSSTSDEDTRPTPRRRAAAAADAGRARRRLRWSSSSKTIRCWARRSGAEQARRLRQQFAELLQRIARRARTPDDRDRLTERAGRLNPDGWADEAAIQAAVVTVEADWAAIALELPRRRRGRRGGRHANDARANAAREPGPLA